VASGGRAREHGVSNRWPRNRRTASRNRAAPNAATSSVPPARSTKRISRAAATRRSSVADLRTSVANGGSCAADRYRPSSMTTGAQRWSNEVAGASGGARRARCRWSRSRSSTRVPRPRVQLRTVRVATPQRSATSAIAAPSESTWATASRITSTPVTLPGSASHGSTRSRCRQSWQRASATDSVVKASGVSSRR